jgi:hypothetical protein
MRTLNLTHRESNILAPYYCYADAKGQEHMMFFALIETISDEHAKPIDLATSFQGFSTRTYTEENFARVCDTIANANLANMGAPDLKAKLLAFFAA